MKVCYFVVMLISIGGMLDISWAKKPTTAGDQKQDRCLFWQSQVDATVKWPKGAPEPDEKDNTVIMGGIECLLRMRNNQNPGVFGGAIDDNVSMIFPPAPANVDALYYISYLYTQNFNHASAVALAEKGEFNSPATVEKAYDEYNKWFKKVMEVGLDKAREMKLDPLKGSTVVWY